MLREDLHHAVGHKSCRGSISKFFIAHHTNPMKPSFAHAYEH